MVRGETDYQGLAEYARASLKWEAGLWCSAVYVEHANPLTGEPCSEALRISFASWEKAQTSRAMDMTSGVSTICTVCGHTGFLDANQKWVQF